MSDENDNYIERVRFAVAKLGADAVQELPIVGSPVVDTIDALCKKVAWAGDYINQTEGGTGGPGCEGIKASLSGSEALPSPGDTPAVTTGKKIRHLD